MLTRIVPLLAFALALVTFTPLTVQDAAAIPEPVQCHSGIDGTNHCVARAAGCEVHFSQHPERGAQVDSVDC